MFDWNDEELANIIWGEVGVSDDHIVPYPEVSVDLGNKKEWNQEAARIKLTEQKRPEVKIDVHHRKLGSSSNLDNSGGLSASGYGTNSRPELSLSIAAKTDQRSLEETAQHGKDAGVFQNAHEGKEQGDLVDYGWGNIGSFDDLDQIFSNDDPIFSHVSLDNAGELWSSKDLSNSAAPMSLDSPSPAGGLSYEKTGGPASHDMQNVHAITADMKYAGGTCKPAGKEHQKIQDMIGRTISASSGLAAENVTNANELTDKVFAQDNLFEVPKKSQGRQEGKGLQDFYGGWSPSTNLSRQFDNQLAPSSLPSSPSSIFGKHKQIQGAETFYQNITNPCIASPMYGNHADTYPAIPMLPQAQSGDLRHKPLLSGYEVSSGIVNPVQKSGDSVKSLTMTPQEKIEKLRRRQQMQAMLAIQKQQQQLGNQVPSTSKSITQNCPLEMQTRPCDGADLEDLSTFPALDLSIEHDDSNKISAGINDCFVEETLLYRLQDIISKLDIKIRLCIRDSLFRLAQSAMQRHYASDTSSTNKSSREEHNVVAKEEANYQNRYARMPDVETETNPIDRTVAHLLFHRPLELTGDYSDRRDLPISAKMHCESKAANLLNSSANCLPDEDLKSNPNFSHQGLKNSCALFEAQAQPVHQFRHSPCLDTSENASNNGPADVGAQELEESQ